MAPLQTEELEKRMQPGELSVKGFLAPGERLGPIIAADAATLAAAGLRYEDLANPLEQLILAGETNPGRKVNTGHFTVRVTLTTGFQQCPWTEDIHHSICRTGSGASHASVDWYIRNNQLRREMTGPGLIVHLVRDHHFFEGPRSPYRVDPLALAQLLGL
jgi:hypothetical protein